LIQRLVAFFVQSGATSSADSVEFVDENDTRGFLARFREEFANARGTTTDKELHKFRGGDWEESDAGFTGDRSRE
tara:strand:+ start:574 stop:798 length:225 start_codon:yes stop_codon:yes gene_type:complete